MDIAVTPESRNLAAPHTSLEIGEGCTRGRNKKSRKESLNKGVGRKSEQTRKDDRRKRGPNKAASREQSRPKRSRQEEINQSLPPDAGTGVQYDQKLQELVMSFKSLKFRQVKNPEDENTLEVYRELNKGELNWTAVMEDDAPNSIMTVCRQHAKKIQEISARNTKLKQRRTLGSTILDTILSDQEQPSFEVFLTTAAVSTGESTETTL